MSGPIERHRRRGCYREGGKNAHPTSRSDSLTPARQFNSTYQTVHQLCRRLKYRAGENTVQTRLVNAAAVFSLVICWERVAMFGIRRKKENKLFRVLHTASFSLCPSLLFASLGFYSLEQNLQLWPPFTTIFYTVHFRSTCGMDLQV